MTSSNKFEDEFKQHVGEGLTMIMNVEPIGYVRSSFTDIHPIGLTKRDFSKQEAIIEILPKYASGLKGMNNMIGKELMIVYRFHRSADEPYSLIVRPHHNEKRELRGVFATQCNRRPNFIGLCHVTLLAYETTTTIKVIGLDAVDGSPVIDIKPYSCCVYQGDI